MEVERHRSAVLPATPQEPRHLGRAEVPVPGAAYDGAFINHPDVDLTDPGLNTSGVPWHTLYYKENYPPLQRIKARWDPRDLFRHALSIRMR
jgi:hypothetical protein